MHTLCFALAVAFTAQDDTAPDAAAAPTPSLPSVAERLPGDCIAHLEAQGFDELRQAFTNTSLGKLVAEDDLQTFIKPWFDEVMQNLHWLIDHDPDMPETLDKALAHNFVNKPDFGRLSISFFDFEADEERATVALTATVPGYAQELYDFVRGEAMEEEEGFEDFTVGGFPGFRNEANDSGSMWLEMVKEGDRLWVLGGDKLSQHVFGESDEPRLHAAPWYQNLTGQLGMTSPMACGYVQGEKLIGMVTELIAQAPPTMTVTPDGDSDGSVVQETDTDAQAGMEAAKEMLTGSPMISALKGIAIGMEAAGDDLRERWYLHAPDGLESLGLGAPMTGIAADHAALADRNSDIFITYSYDLPKLFEMQKAEMARIDKLSKEAGIDDGSPVDEYNQMLEQFENLIGFNLEEDLVPCLGQRFSFFMDVPGALSVPPLGVIVDIQDAEKFDAVIDKLMARNAEIAEVDFTLAEYKGSRILSANLINAGVPVIPSLARVDGQMLMTLSPQSLKSAIINRDREKNLLASERLKPLEAFLGQEPTNLAAWVDLNAVVGFAYNTTMTMLPLMTMEAEFDLPIDPSLAPSADVVTQHFGHGFMRAVKSEGGYAFDGQSAVANPMIGGLATLVAVIAAAGAGTGIDSQVTAVREKISGERMSKLASALRTYKNSVGGGSWPTNLVQLVDRGILTDLDVLVDPADPKPRRVKSGTGERIPVSYQLGDASGLEEYTRQMLGIEQGAETQKVLYTRGAWYEHWTGPGRLVLPVEVDDAQATTVSEEEFTGGS